MVTTSSVVYPMFIMVVIHPCMAVIHQCMEDMVTAEFLLVVSTKKQTDSFHLTNNFMNHDLFSSTNKIKPLILMTTNCVVNGGTIARPEKCLRELKQKQLCHSHSLLLIDCQMRVKRENEQQVSDAIQQMKNDRKLFFTNKKSTWRRMKIRF